MSRPHPLKSPSLTTRKSTEVHTSIELTSRRKHSQAANLDLHIEVWSGKYESMKRKCLAVDREYDKVRRDYQELIGKSKEKGLEEEGRDRKGRGKIKRLEGGVQREIDWQNELLAANGRLKILIDQKRIAKKQVIKKQQELKNFLSNLEKELAELKQKHHKSQEKCNARRFLMHDIIYQNENEKENYKLKFQSELQQFNPKAKSVYKSNDATTVDCLALVKFRIKRLYESNRLLQKHILQYVKLLDTIDKQFKTILRKTSFKGLQELTEEFIRSDQRNILLQDQMSYLSRKAQQLQQHNSGIKTKIREEKMYKKQLECKQNVDSEMKSSQDKVYIQWMKSSQVVVDRMDQFQQKAKPILSEILTNFSNNPNLSHVASCHLNIESEPLLTQLSYLQKYLNYYAEMRWMGTDRPCLTWQKNILQTRKSAPHTEIGPSDDKCLMGEQQLRNFAKQILAKKALQKNQKYVSWVK